MIYELVPVLACLAAACARDMKSFKTLPAVTNSLVNLGKMDISFHFNMRPQDFPADQKALGLNSIFSPNKEEIIEPCPCSSFKYMKDSTQNHPTDFLNRILSGNDLFSFKEPESSTLCCDSHENIHEDILLEFSPKQSQVLVNPQNSNAGLSFLPYLLESLQKRPSLPTMPVKPKAVEILFFPKKSGIRPTKSSKLVAKNKSPVNKDAIKIVGDRVIKNDFKSFLPPLTSSIKKDLSLQENINATTTKEAKNLTVDNKVM